MSADQRSTLPGWWWGSNPPTDQGDDQVHVVHPDQPRLALCRLQLR